MAFKKAIFRIDAQGSNSENSGRRYVGLSRAAYPETLVPRWSLMGHNCEGPGNGLFDYTLHKGAWDPPR